jgi:thymidylate kinase
MHSDDLRASYITLLRRRRSVSAWVTEHDASVYLVVFARVVMTNCSYSRMGVRDE